MNALHSFLVIVDAGLPDQIVLWPTKGAGSQVLRFSGEKIHKI